MSNEYDRIARFYDPLLYFGIRRLRIRVMELLQSCKDRRILDLCCGTGNQLKLLAENGFDDLHCLDISEAMLDIARQDAERLHIYRKDATSTGFAAGTFDVVLLSFAIHEKEERIQYGLLDEAHRLLNTEGLLLVVDYIFDQHTKLTGRITIPLIERLAGKQHYRNFRAFVRRKGLSGLISEKMFTIISSERMLFNAVTVSVYKRR
jgi:demethylmenaquinone methyltransferase/2-methoxy-6-polyprenyl-1,4-benzoquinol methylase